MVEGLRFERDGGVGRLTFARPEKKNAITYQMWSAIPDVVAEVEADPEIIALVLTGAGTDFSAGADISEFGRLRSTAESAAAYDKVVEAAVTALAEMRKPSVAMIRGNCIGGGCQVSVACDFRFAQAGARFGITPAKLGIVYDFRSTRQLVGLIGPAHARYLLLSGRFVDAARAREIGLVNDVFTAEEFEAEVHSFVDTLGQRSQASIRGMNRIIEKISAGQRESDSEVEAIRSAAVHGPDYAEGVAAFLDGRPPRFTYR
ncbi:enoyl-CoA hydratase-related protein [Amycolatopsis taiwanensis]|uniref:Enoyl-CoA hydratase n=1 Tax=Amycolatopsis taiwanensis TaxID=342230 RepID=A0A9W6R7C8_9PSEU|nr:enoyl-CoA hydratase-related protein [Amycolatopsis taiwanensis]GLY68892.1 enoyl-CoA hydratase [Amycolatopsis taiwanensis]